MTQVDLTIDTLTGLDFSPTLPCEHSQHDTHHTPDDPARWEVRTYCKECKRSGHFLLCESGRISLHAGIVIGCKLCGATARWDDFCTSCHPISEVK